MYSSRFQGSRQQIRALTNWESFIKHAAKTRYYRFDSYDGAIYQKMRVLIKNVNARLDLS